MVLPEFFYYAKTPPGYNKVGSNAFIKRHILSAKKARRLNCRLISSKLTIMYIVLLMMISSYLLRVFRVLTASRLRAHTTHGAE